MIQEFRIDFDKKIITNSMITNIEKLKQWIYCALKTERLVYPIYDYQYGNDVHTLINKPISISYIQAEVERMVRETLMVNSEITDVYDFNFITDKQILITEFNVDTIYDTIKIFNIPIQLGKKYLT